MFVFRRRTYTNAYDFVIALFSHATLLHVKTHTNHQTIISTQLPNVQKQQAFSTHAHAQTVTCISGVMFDI